MIKCIIEYTLIAIPIVIIIMNHLKINKSDQAIILACCGALFGLIL